MFDYKLDTKLLPNVWITWASTKGGKFNKRYWLNCRTGVKKDTPEKWMYYPSEREYKYRPWQQTGAIGITWSHHTANNVWVASGSQVAFAYVKYHKRDDVLEVAVVGIDTSRKEEIHEWKYLGGRYFVRRDKVIVDKNGKVCDTYNLYSYHIAWNPNVMFSMLCRLNYNDNMVNEFKKFVGSDHYTIGNGRTVEIQYLWHLQEWHKTKQKSPGAIKGKAQQMVDNLVELPLIDVPDAINEHFNNPETKYSKAVYFERINDEWSVLRIFTTMGDEISRMYISDNGKDRFASNTKDGWITCNPPRYKYDYSHFINKSEAIEGCKRIKYAMDALNGIDDRRLTNCLFAVLKMPDLEQLAKLGCASTVKSLVMQTYPKAELKHWVGEYYNEKGKNLLRKIGLNKSQLDYFASKFSDGRVYYASNYSRALEEMRLWFGNDLSHIDTSSFERYLEGFHNIKNLFWRDLRGTSAILGVEYEKFVKNLIRLGEKNNQAYRLINDAISAFTYLNANTRPEIDWYFDDYSDIVRIHDALVELRNAQEAERRLYWSLSEQERVKKDEDKRKKVDAERKHYEYEDDEYIIRLPKDLPEIITEGAKQSICIGGYTGRHANGDTNLFFLRQKSNPDKPFYAIEMNNNKHIVQIHGFGNKWLGNDPDAIPTVIRWMRKNGIICSNDILTCTARGYGKTANYVPMPIVD